MAKKKIYINNSSEKLPKTKNGVPVFDNNEDLFSIFTKLDYNPSYTHNDSGNQNPGRIQDHPQYHHAQFLPQSGETDNTINRFNSEAENNPDGNGNENPEESVIRFDKNGLPFLDMGRSLAKMFSDAAAAKVEEFPELLDMHLKGKNRDAMLREKSDRPLPSQLPLKKRLQRYPGPQGELDLHGHTAREAESKAERYIRTCWRDGLFTVRLIVGRGIHSPYGAVLPDVIEDLLSRLKKEGVLLWFEWDRRTKSQSGSVIAYMKHYQ